MKDFLYWLLSTSSFFQSKNGSVFAISNYFLAISLAVLLGTIPITYQHITDSVDYIAALPWLIPFLLLIFLRLTGRWSLGRAPKRVQDKYWKTQLVNFKDPKFRLQRELYPGNADDRERKLEKMWIGEFGTSFEKTPRHKLQKARIVVLFICAAVGLLIGAVAGWLS